MDPRNPDSTIRLACHPQTISKIVQAGLRFKIGEYWGLVHGNPQPNPSPDIEFPEGEPTLLRPTAIFQGLKRPLHHIHMSADEDVLVYVAKPQCTYSFKEHKDYGGILEIWRPPVGSVFTTFVSMNPAHVDGAVRDMQKTLSCDADCDAAGVVLFWEWTESDPQSPEIPYESALRYSKPLYRKGVQ
jgi:hypothetical protein